MQVAVLMTFKQQGIISAKNVGGVNVVNLCTSSGHLVGWLFWA